MLRRTMPKTANIKAIVQGLLLSTCCLSAPVMADDTEIFFGQAAGTDVDNPNLLFILDTSGSMRNLDGGTTSRMDRLKDAMNSIIDQSSSFNVGLMSFNGHQQGGPIRIPIGNLEGVSDTNCPDTGCPDELVISRPRGSTDDAVENAETGVVTVNDPSLVIGDLESTTIDTGIPTDAVVIDGEATLTATVSEAMRFATSVTEHKNDELADSWFYTGTLDTHAAPMLGYKFDGVGIPNGAVVTSATLEFSFTNLGAQQGEVSAYISAEATSTPSTYPDASLTPSPDPNPLLGERTLTSKFTSWPDIPKDNSSTGLITPELKEIVQEVIGLPGWAQGNAISFIIEPFDSYEASADDLRIFHGVGAPANKLPKLKYSYYMPTDASAGTIDEPAVEHLAELFNPTDSEYTGDSDSTSVDLFYAGTEYDAVDYALTFDNIDIPEDAIITGAYLSMTGTGGTGEFIANISAELSANPEMFDDEALNTRVNTTSFIEWPLPDATGETNSPDLTELIKELRELTDWEDEASVVLRLSPGSNYIHDGTMLRTFDTSEGTTPPRLNISWQIDNSNVGSTVPTQTAGIRFPNIHIPPSASIVSATIEFNSASANDAEATFEIRGEASDNAEPFTGTNLDITSRDQTLAGVNWEVDPWDTVGNKFSSVDVTPIVQELLNQADWCGGNAMAMLISGSGSREAVSFDASSINAPALKITYSPDSVPTGAYCSNRSSVIGIEASVDDAIENQATGAVSLSPSNLDLIDASGQKHSIGLRFRGVPIPQGTTLVNATIELTAAEDVPPGATATIYIDDADDSQPMTTANQNISDRSSAGSISWTNIPAASAGDSLFTPDISDLIESVVNRPGWAEGNALTIGVKAETGGANTSFETYATDETMSARLILYYQGESTVAGTVFRENLKNAVNELPATDGTPIVDAYYEGVNYLLGRPVDYGKQRGWGGSNAVDFRVSHPDSYTGGTVVREAGCSDADLANWDCRSEEITGNPQYISPIQSQCQQNHIVLLSDGEATSNTSASKVRALMGVDACSMADDDASDEACGREFADWLASSDHSSTLPGPQNIITHTIGFNLSTPAFLQNIATQGGGQFYSAESSADLLEAFRNIFDSVSKSDTSFVAPSASVNQFNRLRNRDDIYFSLFKPEATARWSGNLKRYKLQGTAGQTANIVDATGANVIDPATGEFKSSSRSFWSSKADGGQVTVGGAAGELEGSTARVIVTYNGTTTDLMHVDNRVATGNTNILTEDFDLPPQRLAEADYVENLLKWTAGQDVKDEDGDTNVTENRTHMGDPLHSQPLILNYTPNGTNPVSVIYFATNEGYLHAIDHDDGSEHFAFIPKNLFKNLHHFYDNDVSSKRIYGLDGSITSWIVDVDKDGVIDKADGDKAYLYFGMRRGGRNYYALDVTDFDNPKYMWHIEGDAPVSDLDPTTADGDWTDLGQSWSKLSKTKIRDGSTIKDVLIFGGGYDPSNHDELNGVPPGVDADGNRKEDFLGRGIYIADAVTGKLLWKPDVLTDPDYSDMLYSIPSDLRVIDINGDGLMDQVYFGDLGAQVWRMDINTSESATTYIDDRITAGVIADFSSTGETNRRRFYYPPDISVVSISGQQYLSVAIGSGWRAHPLDTDVEDRFYNFRLTDVYGPPLDTMGQIVYNSITEDTTGMLDVTNQLGHDPRNAIGWFIDLEASGEKVLAPSITINRQIIFTTYIPASVSDACSAAVGTGRMYIVDALNGDPVNDLEANAPGAEETTLTKGDRNTYLSHAGIPPPANVLFPETGKTTIMLGTEKVDGVDLIPKGRTFWQEHLDEDS